jgi:putative DNA primase/helicase
MKRDVSELMPLSAVNNAKDAFPDIVTIGMKLTDLGNAERLVARYRDRIRYCPSRKAWFVWDGKRWRLDETGEIYRFAKRTVRGIYAEAEHANDEDARRAIAKHARESEKKARIDSMIALASTEEGIPIVPDELDADPWKLNANNGTICLKTKKLTPHNPADFITKLVPIDYAADAQHPLWDRFLSDVTGGDADLAKFLQRFAGYSATGLTSEKRFFFVYSRHHDTGKSTIADALRSALGDYAVDADFETWLEQSNVGGNRGDVARLTGARLVISVEVRRKAKFDTKLVKAITGGDPITCSAKYEREFTYKPRFKIMLVANEAPSIREDDRPMFERCLRIPFDTVVPLVKRDPEVKRRLSDPTDAGPAVLRWIVDGAVAWQREGLGIPTAVKASSDAYAAEMDRFGKFVAECCAIEIGASVTKKDLRETYEAWCKESGIKVPLSAKETVTWLTEHGIADGKTGGVRFWRGIRLKRGDEDDRDTRDAVSPNFPHEKIKEEVTENAAPDVPMRPSGVGEEAPPAAKKTIDPEDAWRVRA